MPAADINADVNVATTTPDINHDNEHTIEQRSAAASPPSTPSKTDEVLYCHFIPKKEFVEKGTPWIIHSKDKCYVCATVNFESMAMMRTAGPGGEAPDPVVCKCGVSRHHLRVEGYVTMTKENTPHPEAVIRSHRESAHANIPLMEKKQKEMEGEVKDLKKENKKQAIKLKGQHEDSGKLRATISEKKKALAETTENLTREQAAGRGAQTKLQQKDMLMQQLQDQVQQLREGGGGGKGPKQRKQQDKAAAQQAKVQEDVVRLQTEQKKWRLQAEFQGVARARLATQVTDLRQQLEQALLKVERAESKVNSAPPSPSKSPKPKRSKSRTSKSPTKSGASVPSLSAALPEPEPEVEPEADVSTVSTDSDQGDVSSGKEVAAAAEADRRLAAIISPRSVADQDISGVDEDEAEAERWLTHEPAAAAAAPVQQTGMMAWLATAQAVDVVSESDDERPISREGSVSAEPVSMNPDGPALMIPGSGPPVTIGAAYTPGAVTVGIAAAASATRDAAPQLDGRGVTAADLIRQRQNQRRAQGVGGPVAATAPAGSSWGGGRSAHGLAGAAGGGTQMGHHLRGPSSTGISLADRVPGKQQSGKNWGGNPFGGKANGAGMGLAVSGVVMGRPAGNPNISLGVGGGPSTWHPIIAGGAPTAFRGRRR